MRKYDLLSSAIWFSMGLFIVLYALQFDLGNLSEPGSGFMPFLAGVLMCIFSGITFFRAFLEKPGNIEKLWGDVKFRRVIFVILALVIFALLLEKIGFLLCTFFLIFVLIYSSKKHTLYFSLIVAGLTATLSYLLLETWLKSQLPRGIFGF
jgi:putative tricarboxylic transport membrane protein